MHGTAWHRQLAGEELPHQRLRSLGASSGLTAEMGAGVSGFRNRKLLNAARQQFIPQGDAAALTSPGRILGGGSAGSGGASSALIFSRRTPTSGRS